MERVHIITFYTKCGMFCIYVYLLLLAPTLNKIVNFLYFTAESGTLWYARHRHLLFLFWRLIANKLLIASFSLSLLFLILFSCNQHGLSFNICMLRLHIGCMNKVKKKKSNVINVIKSLEVIKYKMLFGYTRKKKITKIILKTTFRRNYTEEVDEPTTKTNTLYIKYNLVPSRKKKYLKTRRT